MAKVFNQLCVWEGTEVAEDAEEHFTKFFKDQMNVRIKYAEQLTTRPDRKDGEEVADTGGRLDALFYIHDDDISLFAVLRLSFAIRWWEDVLGNNKKEHGFISLYSNEIIEKYPVTWDFDTSFLDDEIH